MFKKSMDFGQAGDNVGLLLRGLKREDILYYTIYTTLHTPSRHIPNSMLRCMC